MQQQLNLINKPVKGNDGGLAAGRKFIQPKLAIDHPDGSYGQQADAMTDTVMQMESAAVQAKDTGSFFKPAPVAMNPVQRKCEHCEEEEKKAQRKEINGETTTADAGLESYVGRLGGGGQSLPGEVRSFYEPRFGYDFSQVKVHTDTVAAKSAQSINALAYTSGNHIVFNSGQYAPQTDSGKRLLGHELTHVVQQGAAVSRSMQVQKKGTDEEDAVMRKPVPGMANAPVQLAASGISRVAQPAGVLQRQHTPVAPPSAAAAPAPHARAVTALANMMHYKNNENILFDWWANDCRDNDNDGLTDAADPNEIESQDGDHYNGTYSGFTVQPGVTCRSSDGGWYTPSRRVVFPGTVKYRVCADLISQAWTDARVPMGHRRSVVSIIDYVRHNRQWHWWPIASFPGPFIPGDLLFSRHGGLGHATMVVSAAPAGANPMIIHLPGQTQLISTGQYRPHIANDVQVQNWWPRRHQYGVARYTG